MMGKRYERKNMATYQEVRQQIENLTPDEQLSLLEDLAEMVRRRMVVKRSFAELRQICEEEQYVLENPVRSDRPNPFA
jgi:uncharacterized protein (DUF488 family)